MLPLFLTALFLLGGTLFGFFAARACVALRWAHRLPELPAGDLPPLPRCSIIFAARDEQDRIGETLRHILQLRHVQFEVIPVDDRSRDGTSQILKNFSAEEPRVKPKRIDSLPNGWLGKCHACHVGAESASGEWLLFTDADCWLQPDVLARALLLAEREKVDHVTLTPGVAPETTAAAAWHIAFLLTVLDWIRGVNEDNPKAHLGMGAFNLVRAKTYRAFTGHEPLRLTVVEDVRLGRLVRQAGGRTRGFIGGDDVECHWGVTVRQMIRIMEKNYFAAMNYHTFLGLTAGLLLPALWLVCVLGPLTGTFAGFAAAISVFALALPACLVARRLRWPLRTALLTPLIFPVLYYAVLNSTLVTLRQGGVRWRDTFYPLDILRKHTVR